MRKALLFLLCFCTKTMAIERFVDTTGTDSGACLTGSPCLTLEYAESQSLSGDTINVAAGTYTSLSPSPVSINKTLTLKGAQNGTDARTRVGPESILSYHSGLWIKASNVVIDGFTIKNSDNNAFLGYGIAIFPGDNILPQVDGTKIINNIFTNNIVGLGISNQGSTQALVEHNLFIGNNRPGPAFGTGIYTDEYVGKTTTNVLINENTFEDNDNAGIGFSVSDNTMKTSNVTITNNLINNCGRGIYLLNTQHFNITDNTISNLTAPTDTGSSSAINIFDGVSDVSILRNNLQTGARYGIRIQNIIAGPNASGVLIHLNNITGFTDAGMRVFDAPTSTTDYATCNWWGSDTGPTSTLNPGGTGDVVDGNGLTSADVFNPWLLGLAPDGPCGKSLISLSKTFNPQKINALETSTLIITLINSGNTAATLIDPFVDNLPSGMQISGNASTSCGGSLDAVFGSEVITLTGGSILANSSCTISVDVKIRMSGSYTNTLPQGSLVTNIGSNTEAASATIVVGPKKPHGGGKRNYCVLNDAGCSLLIEVLPLAVEPIAISPVNVPTNVEPASLFIAPKNPAMLIKSFGCTTSTSSSFSLLLFVLLFLRFKHKLLF